MGDHRAAFTALTALHIQKRDQNKVLVSSRPLRSPRAGGLRRPLTPRLGFYYIPIPLTSRKKVQCNQCNISPIMSKITEMRYSFTIDIPWYYCIIKLTYFCTYIVLCVHCIHIFCVLYRTVDFGLYSNMCLKLSIIYSEFPVISNSKR